MPLLKPKTLQEVDKDIEIKEEEYRAKQAAAANAVAQAAAQLQAQNYQNALQGAQNYQISTTSANPYTQSIGNPLTSGIGLMQQAPPLAPSVEFVVDVVWAAIEAHLRKLIREELSNDRK